MLFRSGATRDSLVVTNLTAAKQYRAIVTSGVYTPAVSDTATILVSELAVGGTLSGSGAVCYNSNSNVLSLSGNNGSVVRWEYSTSSNFSGATLEATTDTFLSVNNLTQTTYYRVRIANGACSTYSSTATLSVDPTSVAGTASGDTLVCTGSNSAVIRLSGYTGTIQWQVSADNNTFNDITLNGTGATYTASGLTDTMYYRAVVTSGVCSPATSGVVTVNVSETAIPGTISGNGTVCFGSNTSTLSLNGYRGTIQWQQSATINGTYSNMAGRTSDTLIISNLTANRYYRAFVTNGACTATSTAVGITVDPLSVGGTLSGSKTVCTGTNSSAMSLSGNVGTIVRWESSTDSFATNVTDIANTISSYTASGLTQTTYYRVVVKSGVCDSAYSSVVKITVSELAQGGKVLGATRICTGNSVTLTLNGAQVGTPQWQSATTGAFANIAGQTSNSYTTPNLDRKSTRLNSSH